MFRYVALIWDSKHPALSTAALDLQRPLRSAGSEWTCEFEGEGIAVFCAGSTRGRNEARRLQPDRGVILGTMFSTTRDGVAEPSRLSTQECSQIADSRGRALVQSYWGRYVAFTATPGDTAKYVIRDPLGGLECFHTAVHGVNVVFSSLQHCPVLSSARLSINWRFVAASLSPAVNDTRTTGLNEVTRILGGECLCLRDQSVSKTFYWNPLQIAASRFTGTSDEAVEIVRHTTKACINAWSDCYPNILLMLSGGVDSAVILQCLGQSRSRQRLNCFNIRWIDEKDTDEVSYAQLAARSLRTPLITRDFEARTDLRPFIPAVKHPSPYPFALQGLLNAQIRPFAHECGATGLFHGIGGDEVFCLSDAQSAFDDHLYHFPFHTSTLRRARETSRLTASSVWSVLLTAIRSARDSISIGELVDLRSRSMIFLRPELANSAVIEDVYHPWFDSSVKVAPSKFLHALCLAVTHPCPAPNAEYDDPDDVYPLLSQPLVELCLRIPTYMHTSGDWDRILERSAFSGQVPSEIIWRRSKGMLRHANERLVNFNLPFIRGQLLDGILMQNNILDQAPLAKALSDPQPASGAASFILFALTTEVWLRNLHGLVGRQAAKPHCTQIAAQSPALTVTQ